MGWLREYFKENLRQSFALWERHEAISVLIGLLVSFVLAALSSLGLARVSQLSLVTNLGIFLLAWFGWLILIVTPVKMWKEKADIVTKLTTKRLAVPSFDTYDPSPEERRLRLRVLNISAEPISNCYGTLISCRMLFNDPRSEQNESAVVLLNQRLPPVGHRFVWSNDREETDIPGKSADFLQVVMRSSQYNPNTFRTASATGPDFPKIGMGDYEYIIEVGSRSVAFPPTRVRFVFEAFLQRLQAKAVSSI